ncbi:MAG: hypothetical protein AAF909_09570 [Pseudomonadota bacterium]
MTTERWNSMGLLVSAGLHAGLFGLAVIWGDIFVAPDEDPLEIVDLVVISEDELEQLIAPDAIDLAEARPPTPIPAEPVFSEPTPPPPEPEAAALAEPEAAEPDVEPEATPDAPPLERAPPAPELAFDQRALEDESPGPDIREAVDPVRVAEAPEPSEPAVADTAPQVSAAAPAPPPPELADASPVADTPDTPPEPEPEPEPESEVAFAAPASATVPKLRPRRAPARARAPEVDDSLIDEILIGADLPQGRPTARPTPAAAQRSRPITQGERAFFEASFRRNWVRITDAPDLAALAVVIDVTLSRSGEVLSTKLVRPTSIDSARQQVAVRRAQTAITLGQPYAGPPEKYDQWRVLRVTFDLASERTTIN